MLGSLAGVCLMIDQDYESFMTDKAFYKRISSLEKSLRGSTGSLQQTKECRLFSGPRSFPAGFLLHSQSFSIEVTEYSREYMQNLRVLHKYTKADFFESLQPATNEDKMKALFDRLGGQQGRYPLFSTADRRFAIKQISKYEKCTLLRTFLIPYHQHVIRNSSLICRLLGLFSVRVKYVLATICVRLAGR